MAKIHACEVGMKLTLVFGSSLLTAAMGASFALTAYILMAERERRHRDPASLSFYGFLFAALLWAVVQPLWQFPWAVLGDRVSRILERDDPDYVPARMITPGESAPRGLGPITVEARRRPESAGERRAAQ